MPIRRKAGVLLLGVEQAKHGRPFQHAVGPPRAGLIEMRGVRQHVLARHGQLGARRHRVDLGAAGLFELVHGVERLLHVRPAGEEAMVPHDQGIVLAEIADDPLALVEIDRRPFVVVIADVADEADRSLRQRQQPALHGRHRDAGPGVGVQHAFDLRPRLVDRAVDHVAGLVDAVVGVGLGDDLALDVDLDQARRGDLLIKETIEIDQQVFGAGNARRDVVVDQVGHLVLIDQPVAGGELDPSLPFLRRNLVFDRLEVGIVLHDTPSPDRGEWLIRRDHTPCPQIRPTRLAAGVPGMAASDILKKDKLARGEVAASMTVRLSRSIEIARIAKTAGFDMLYIDLEHSPLTMDATGQICMACLDIGIMPAVRVPANTPEYISRILDAGALGVIAPHVRSAAEAREVVRAAKLPPLGERSNTGIFPHLQYRSFSAEETAKAINDATMVIVQFESADCLEHADEIIAVEGVDIVLVGLNDMLGDMGLAGQYDHPRVREIYQTVIDACRKHGKHCGVGGLASRPDLVAEYVRMGARYVSAGTDLAFLLGAATARAKQIKDIKL